MDAPDSPAACVFRREGVFCALVGVFCPRPHCLMQWAAVAIGRNLEALRNPRALASDQDYGPWPPE